jgi:hypothetical protein
MVVVVMAMMMPVMMRAGAVSGKSAHSNSGESDGDE